MNAKGKDMDSRLPVIDADGEVGDLAQVDAALFRPAAEVLPPDFYCELLALNRQGKMAEPPKATHPKQRITLRLSAEVVAAFRASGKGWQERIDAALREWLATHPRSQ